MSSAKFETQIRCGLQVLSYVNVKGLPASTSKKAITRLSTRCIFDQTMINSKRMGYSLDLLDCAGGSIEKRKG